MKKKNDGIYDAYLAHQGVLGMKWGHRRYQNEDGSYKPGAEGRYYTPTKRDQKRNAKQFKKAYESKDDKQFKDAVKKEFDKVTTKEDIQHIKDLYKKTYGSDYEYYKDENYADPQLTEESLDKFYDNLEEYKSACEDVTKKLIGKYGNTKIKAAKAKTSTTLEERVNWEITYGDISRQFNIKPEEYWYRKNE